MLKKEGAKWTTRQGMSRSLIKDLYQSFYYVRFLKLFV